MQPKEQELVGANPTDAFISGGKQGFPAGFGTVEGLSVCLQTESKELVGRERRRSQKRTEGREGVLGMSGLGGKKKETGQGR